VAEVEPLLHLTYRKATWMLYHRMWKGEGTESQNCHEQESSSSV